MVFIILLSFLFLSFFVFVFFFWISLREILWKIAGLLGKELFQKAKGEKNKGFGN